MFAIHARARWLWAALFVLVLAVAAAVSMIVLIERDHGYGPLVAGGAWGTDGPGVIRTGPADNEQLRLGSGPAYSLSWITNDGSHSAQITSVIKDDAVGRAQWAPLSPDYVEIFRPSRWRAFPAVVPASGTVQVRITVVRPASCRGRVFAPDGALNYDGGYRVRWKSLLTDHVTTIESVGDDILLLC